MDFNSYRRKLAANIKLARKEAKLTQEDMQRHGFNWRHYQEIEAGRINITVETLYRLSKVFKIPLSKLV
jgi:transcriptional regulator with XRE-family HTH domain